ncbi:putative phosphotransferase system protein [Yersinia pseudotuberculosis]|uniref:Phosphotransferase system protein n=1 Tax=Yersinia wautersii TaxID=1341643 RepID=A0ABM9TFW3_9GAMM|nr:MULTISPECIES: PTS galactosamine/N-acetylgalactosamine transporter subunit IIA [Yersinia pseudotuberculosis complex]CFV22283.1 putative phosphotransferase system protein [Yersinia pseudotuberculosis]CNK96100.1 putative phosphotransferase system protein [Yersinia pseudotuberculosis]CRG50554.1 putative phosphotransferase system protein [Yersinia wautersii]
MLGVILTGHGGFASGLYQAVCQVIGKQTHVVAIDFPEGMGTHELATKLNLAVTECEQGDGVVFLTDILGGSPFRCAALICMAQPNIEVITGTNMQLLIEMLLDRNQLTPAEFREQAIFCGQRGITSLWHENQKNQPCINPEGI